MNQRSKFLWLAGLILTGAAQAQQAPALEVGIKAGGTFSHGYTTIAPQPGAFEGVTVPEVNNKSNGVGTGYSAGIWARKNFQSIFLQAEVSYNRFLLKQKTNVPQLDVNASTTLSSRLPVSIAPGLVFATLNATSESVLESINVPLLVGKRWLDGRLRVYGGPNLLFVQKAEATRTSSGQINGNAAIGFPDVPIPASTETSNLMSQRAGILEVKNFTYAAEVGVGTTLLNSLDVDLRYALPVGGIYRSTDITGFLGIATLSVGYRLGRF